jgi:alpha-amylase
VVRTPPAALAYLRRGGGETVLVVHNLGAAAAELPLPVPGGGAEPLFADPGAALSKEAGGWRARLPPRASGIWRMGP